MSDDDLIQRRKNFRPVEGIANDTPEYLVEWVARVRALGTFPASHLDYCLRIANEPRMRDFWSWFASVRFTRSDTLRNAHTIVQEIRRSARLPGKPSNMTPAMRETYFKKVRRHANALIDLLENTRYESGGFRDRELTEEELSKTLREVLNNWGDDEDEEGHVVAFLVQPIGRFQSSIDYPEGTLSSNLSELVNWTYWTDQWDGDIFGTSAPIAQSNSESLRLIYFSCTLYDTLFQRGAEMPFPILASVANVALNLGPDEQADEETVRKQVRRFQARRAKDRDLHPYAFEE